MLELKNARELFAAAEDKWPYILADLAPALQEAIDAGGEHVSCPVHGGTDGFRFFGDYAKTGGAVCNTCGPKSNGLRLLAWQKGYSQEDAFREVANWLNGEAIAPTILRRPAPVKAKPKDIEKAREKLFKVWRDESQPIAGTPAEKYLMNRGIWKENIPKSLRYHPGLYYFCKKSKKILGQYPALLSPFKNKDGTVITVHRTYITKDGKKAPVPEVKKMMAMAADELNGGAIKLFQAGEVLGIAEGVETALAAYAIARIPMWACATAPLMPDVVIPACTRHVVIFADKDKKNVGQCAAELLADKLCEAGKSVEILIPSMQIPPESKGVDWLDVLNAEGIEGFPPRWRNWRATA